MDALARDHQAQKQEFDRFGRVYRAGRGKMLEQRLIIAIVQHPGLGGDGWIARSFDQGAAGKAAADHDLIGQCIFLPVGIDGRLRNPAFGGHKPLGVGLRQFVHHRVVNRKIAVGAIKDAGPPMLLAEPEGGERTGIVAPQGKLPLRCDIPGQMTNEAAVAIGVDPLGQPARTGPHRDPFKPFGHPAGADQRRIDAIVLKAAKFAVQPPGERGRQHFFERIGQPVRLVEDRSCVPFQPLQLLQRQGGLPAMLGSGMENGGAHLDCLIG